MTQNKEYILCSAIWYKELYVMDNDIIRRRGMQPFNIDKGIVVTGWRHGNCIAIVKALCNLRTVQISPDGVGKTVQGFLTNTNRFVDRKEAGKIAYTAEQINKPTNSLYSENLY
jgi:hypothetical protein